MYYLLLQYFYRSNEFEYFVLTYFRKRSCLENYVSFEANDTWYKEHPLSNLYNFDPKKFWASYHNLENQYVILKLTSHSLVLKNYTIIQYIGTGDILKQWSLLGSNDNITWDEIDNQQSDLFCKVGPTKTISINENSWKSYSMFKIIQTGYNCMNRYFMRMSGIELFGDLRSSIVENNINSCKKHLFFNNEIFFTLIILKTS